jgi:hypothetical protein
MRSEYEILKELEVGPPDIDDAPIPSAQRERRWRFEMPGLRPVYIGRCRTCDGQHIPDERALEQLIEWVGELGWAVPPCTCACCSIDAV